MMADHDDLKSQGAARFLHDLYQLRDEIGAQPTILFVKNKKASMPSRVKSRDCEQAETHAENVGDRAALATVYVFPITFVVDPEVDSGGTTFEIRIRAESDRLFEDFLQRDGDFLLHNTEQFLEQALAQKLKRIGDFVGDIKIACQFHKADFYLCSLVFAFLAPSHQSLQSLPDRGQ
jgi:hypothetical protein